MMAAFMRDGFDIVGVAVAGLPRRPVILASDFGFDAEALSLTGARAFDGQAK